MPSQRRFRRDRRGFTVVEFLVCLGVVALLLSIFIPFLARAREMDGRARCARNLATFNVVLREYAKVNNYNLPSVVHDESSPSSYTAFTGADDANPFASGSAVKPNDVTASLFLVMREGYVSGGRQLGLTLFVCPSSADLADKLTDAAGRKVKPTERSNFRASSNLSYGYCSPFSAAPKFRMNTDWLAPGAAVMADKGPADPLGPARDAPPLEIRKANSGNHGGAGQNVLYGDGHVDFQRTPYCGYRDLDGVGDNIYTAAAAAPLEVLPADPPRGCFGRSYGPAAWGDAYLVPSEKEKD